MRRPAITPRHRRAVLWAAIVVGFVGGLIAIVGVVGRFVSPDRRAEAFDPNVAVQLAAAAESAVPGSRVARTYQADGAGRWQVSVIDGEGRCWKVQVSVADAAAKPVGNPALVGCWALPVVADTPTGSGDRPDPATEAAVRGFLTAYLTGGDVSRWALPGPRFALPEPLEPGGYGIGDAHQTGGTVAVNGWVDAPTVTDTDRRVDVTWRLDIQVSDVGPVVSHVDAGPAAVVQASAATTVPPTTAPSGPTSTTSSATSTTRRTIE